VVTNQTVYATSDQLIATATATSGGTPVAGILIDFKATPRSGGNSIKGSATTNSSGVAVFNYRFNSKRDKRAIFDLTASGKVSDIILSAGAVFELR
jgi:hypothetical protein